MKVGLIKNIGGGPNFKGGRFELQTKSLRAFYDQGIKFIERV